MIQPPSKEAEKTVKLIRQHRERIDQIEQYYLKGGLTDEQVRKLLEDGQGPKTRK